MTASQRRVETPPRRMSTLVTRERELDAVRQDAADCRRCDLYRTATQTVFGEGGAKATLMLVGEQPGDAEDERGRPRTSVGGRSLGRPDSSSAMSSPRLGSRSAACT